MRRSQAPSTSCGTRSNAAKPEGDSCAAAAADAQMPALKRRRLAPVLHKAAASTDPGTSRKPFATLSQQKTQQNSSAQAACAEVPTQYYAVLYTRRDQKKKRKNKSFADGVLEVRATGCTLYDEEGKVIARDKVKNCFDMPEGAEVPIGSWDVEVDGPINAENFRSGTCFLKAGAATATAAAPQAGMAPTLQPAGFRPPGGQLVKKPIRPGSAAASAPAALHDPSAPNALILNMQQWQAGKEGSVTPVVVDPYLCQHLRPHQREGVAFLYACVMGLREPSQRGAILADDMGLGKTLQVITLIWTLLRQGPAGKPVARRVIVVTPCSLTQNWADEIRKWLGAERMRALVLQPGAEAKQQVLDFRAGNVHKVMVASYETLRKFTDDLAGTAELLVCDEGHRLKAAGGNKTICALLALRCARRVLVTGTPLQNNLEEFYALVHFVCPDALGSLAIFKRVFGDPILRSRDRGASREEAELGQERSRELGRLTDAFILRRTKALNAAYLPPLASYVVFCRPSALQIALYQQLIQTSAVRSLLRAGGDCSAAGALASISALRKLCNHPDLLHRAGAEEIGDALAGGSDIERELAPLFPADYQPGCAAQSGKLAVLEALLAAVLDGGGGERCVVVSSFTRTLDLVAALCAAHGWSTARVAGDTNAAKRQDVVTAFNCYGVGQVMLLSAKAGGAGMNLIGASRLVLFDSDWNPATDLQAMARIWRDGQTRPCAVYRLLTTGSLDEKMYQRQLMKGELADMMEGGKAKERKGPAFTRDELRALFRLDTNIDCETARIMAQGATAAGGGWQDAKDGVDDAPLAACVAGGGVTYIRKMPSELEQRALAAEGEGGAGGSQEAAPDPQEDAGGEADGCQPAEGQADNEDCGPAAPEVDMQHGSMPDDLDCLEVDAF